MCHLRGYRKQWPRAKRVAYQPVHKLNPPPPTFLAFSALSAAHETRVSFFFFFGIYLFHLGH